MNNLTLALESIDLYKDIIYIYMFNHRPLILLLLTGSISVPFALFHKEALGNGSSYNSLHSLFIYLGYNHTRVEKKARCDAAIKIATYENILQFIVVFSEIFDFKTTVTWMQAGNPVFSLIMINKTVAPALAEHIYIISTKPSQERPQYDMNWEKSNVGGYAN
jgi:hypothetical protein